MSDLPPSTLVPQPSADPLSPFFFRGFFRLLYWIFFKPSAYENHIRFVLSDDANKTGLRDLLYVLKKKRPQRFLLECLFLTIVVTLTNGLIGVALYPHDFSVLSLIVTIIYLQMISTTFIGLIILMGIGQPQSSNRYPVSSIFWITQPILAMNFVFSAATSIGSATLPGWGNPAYLIITAGMACEVSVSLLFGLTASIVVWGIGAIAIVATVAVVVFSILAYSAYSDLIMLNQTLGLGLIFVVGFIGVLRLPIYLFQALTSLRVNINNDSDSLQRLLAHWDEFMILPQPRLHKILKSALDRDLFSGLRACQQFVANPFQRWAVQHALADYLRHIDQAYIALEYLFQQPGPDYMLGINPRADLQSKTRPHFTTRLILAELADKLGRSGAGEGIARWSTSILRNRHNFIEKNLVEVYYELVENEEWNREYLETFKFYRGFRQHGEETYQTFRTLDYFLGRDSLDDLSNAYLDALWLARFSSPLRPIVLGAISKLAEVSRLVNSYQSLTTEVGKRDTLAYAGVQANVVRKMAEEIKSPERMLITRIAQHWLDLITNEQAKLAVPREVHHIRNLYLVGRPVQPYSGHPFVGRQDQFALIRHAWDDATLKSPVILYGQRRMGKTSILYHLEKNLGMAYVTVYINLQSLAAVENMNTFIYNLCDEIQRRLSKASIAVAVPQLIDFAAEPFTGLRHFLNVVEDQLGNSRWLVLLLDEFEIIEKNIDARVFRQDLLYQLRDVMLNRPRFAIVLAGLHTLDQMSRNYWDPFFSGARNIKVSYLDQEAAKYLITNPWDGFELEYSRGAVEYIANITGRQPTLLQSVCSALIDCVNIRLEKEGAEYHPRITLRDVAGVLDEVQETSTYFDAVWIELTDNERCVLSAVAVAQTKWDVPVSRSEVNTKVCDQLSPAEFDQAWALLGQRDMIDLTNDSARFHVELVRRWVAKHKAAA